MITMADTLTWTFNIDKPLEENLNLSKRGDIVESELLFYDSEIRYGHVIDGKIVYNTPCKDCGSVYECECHKEGK